MKKVELFIIHAARSYDKLYHYECPDSLQEDILPGKRVWVPFGPSNKKEEAMVVRVFDDQPSTLKPVSKIIDEEAIVSEEFFRLLDWMKQRYICTYGDVLRCMIPPGMGIRAVRNIVLICNDYAGGKKETEILDRLASSGGEVEYESLREVVKSKDFARVLQNLVTKEVIKIEETYQSRVKEKTIRVVYLIKDTQEVLEEIESEKLKRIQHIKVLEMLMENEYIAFSDLIQFAGVSASVLHTLRSKGYIEYAEMEIMRDPFRQTVKKTYALEPTVEQNNVIQAGKETLKKKEFEEVLLHGVTGSGKTEVYMQLIEVAMGMGRQAIVLVPEISLTPQMVKRFKGRFEDSVAVIHSRLSFGERYDQWRMIRNGKVSVAVGARSAIFAPFTNLGMIIIDEEHEPSYKSEMKPKYHAADIARWRSEFHGALFMQGSATPSVETYFSAKNEKIRLLEMKERANESRLPKVDIVDMRQELENGNRSIFSGLLEQGIQNNRAVLEQGILFINRRGYSSFVLCRSCGYVMHCQYCNISMTYHQNRDRLICHYCGYTEKNPKECPKCTSKYIRDFGVGTQKVEEEIKKKFEGIGIIRMDLDTTTKKNAHETILTEFEDKKIDLLVGTQMIAKGHDFPNVTLVGILAADSMLNTGDIRAPERTFQLLTQSAGRAGRGQKEGRVIIQAYNVDHYSIIAASKHDYHSFYNCEIKLRKELMYPPFTELAVIVFSGTNDTITKSEADGFTKEIKLFLDKEEESGDVKILGPARAPISKIKGKYRWRLVLKAPKEDILIRILTRVSDRFYKDKKEKTVEIALDIQPFNML